MANLFTEVDSAHVSDKRNKVTTYKDKAVVFRIEDNTNRQDVYCTTYQMRNFYLQLRDAMPASLDVFNYIQHHWLATMAEPGDKILDVCCGRGLMLPLLRYHAKQIHSYVGVDIEPKNATFLRKRVTDGQKIDSPSMYYPFPVKFIEAAAEDMVKPLKDLAPFNFLIYTSSIEHMHPDAAIGSLRACHEVAAKNAYMVLTTPCAEGNSGYDTRYRAHVYEHTLPELRGHLESTGWKVTTEWGLDMRKKISKRVWKRRDMEICLPN